MRATTRLPSAMPTTKAATTSAKMNVVPPSAIPNKRISAFSWVIVATPLSRARAARDPDAMSVEEDAGIGSWSEGRDAAIPCVPVCTGVTRTRVRPRAQSMPATDRLSTAASLTVLLGPSHGTRAKAPPSAPTTAPRVFRPYTRAWVEVSPERNTARPRVSNGTVAPISIAGIRISGVATPRLPITSFGRLLMSQPREMCCTPAKVHGKSRPHKPIANSSRA